LVTTNDGVEKEGQLLEVGEQEITLEWTEGKGKKALQQQMQIQYENIKSTIVQVQF
jgi:ribosome maturation factor RimP